MFKKTLPLALIALGIVMPCRAAAPMDPAESRSVRFTADYRLTPSLSSRNVRFVVVVPRSLDGRQEVTDLRFSVQPARVFDVDGTRYAEFRFDRLSAPADISITADLLLRSFDAASLAAPAQPAGREDLGRYTAAEPYIEADAADLRPIVAAISGANALETARSLFDYVNSALRYNGYVPADTGALMTLKRGWGDCSDYTDLLVALCRAKGIPARTIDGYLVDFGNETPCHTWAEIYVDGKGWVPVDPLLVALGRASFDRMKPGYIYLSSVRNDRVLDRFHFFSCSFSGSRVAVSATYSTGSAS